MLNISKLFGKSPFTPLQTHMKKVSCCVEKLLPLLKAIESQNIEEIQKAAKKISKLEHEADLTKNDIRNNLPRSLLLPINRQDFLNILSLQDSFADQAEDIATLATLRKLDNYNDLKEDFEFFYKENIEAFKLATNVINEFDTLLESSFGGIEAEKVKTIIDEIAFKEHEIDILQYALVKKLYEITNEMHYSLFNLWLILIREIGHLSNFSEKLGNTILMILESK